MDQQCFVGEHRVLVMSVGVVGLVVCVLGPPVCIVFALAKYRNSSEEVLLFLHHSYKKKYYWWESVRLAYLLALVVVRVLLLRVPDWVRMDVFLALQTILIFCILGFKPHRFK